jgi:hypothetical protein
MNLHHEINVQAPACEGGGEQKNEVNVEEQITHENQSVYVAG